MLTPPSQMLEGNLNLHFHCRFLMQISKLRLLQLNQSYGSTDKILISQFGSLNVFSIVNRSVFDLETIPILHPHYHTHSGNTSRPVNLAVVRWLVSYEDENEYGNDNGNEIED